MAIAICVIRRIMTASLRERIFVVAADITKLPMDAIVNAANNSLLGGGGVDGAIHRAAGPQLLEECKTLGGCETGGARITRGYRLPSKYVIHTVGPVWEGGIKGEPELLAACHRASLALALEHRIRRLAFPAISCGAYGYPARHAAKIALGETAAFLTRHEQVEEVTFACFEEETFWAYERALNALF
jgi:O-acetyl-ADP-ribose deacetylase (regulator of RNase III)